MKTKQDIVENYIQQFRQFGEDVVDCFSNGMCYQFMVILQKRFGPLCTTPLYDEITNHFATKIGDRIYDINGDITDDPRYNWKRWTSVVAEDYCRSQRIYHDCVDKVPADVLICKYCNKCLYEQTLNAHICSIDNKPIDVDAPCSKGGSLC
jgi:hypothetical protein